MSRNSAEATFAEVIQRMTQNKKTASDIACIRWAEIHLARLRSESRKFFEALETLNALPVEGFPNSKGRNILINDFLVAKCHIMTRLGEADGATECFDELLTLSRTNDATGSFDKMGIAWEVHQQYTAMRSPSRATRAMVVFQQSSRDLVSQPWKSDNAGFDANLHSMPPTCWTEPAPGPLSLPRPSIPHD
ncbi:putative Clr5 domain-containing protein [Seiridium unicorne]|uniref:Clr5 domain-containing protein n=1 Tax=Seiridium unicorne TaxID=138068 RepID=A0ABR2V004_9PEZI